MPRPTLGIITAAVLLIPLAGCYRAEAVARAPFKAPVHVNVTCDIGVNVGLVDDKGNSAWVVELTKNDEMEWEPGPSLDSIAMSPKAVGDWPLATTTPFKGKKGEKPKGKVKADANKSDPYGYLINAYCPRPDGSTLIITIDPDMIILQGMKRE